MSSLITIQTEVFALLPDRGSELWNRIERWCFEHCGATLVPLLLNKSPKYLPKLKELLIILQAKDYDALPLAGKSNRKKVMADPPLTEDRVRQIVQEEFEKLMQFTDRKTIVEQT